MDCHEIPKGPHERKVTYSAPMTPADAARAAAFMAAMDAWLTSVRLWEVYINGAAAYWGGRPPRKPGPAPLPPGVENTACQTAAKRGAKAIFAELQKEVAGLFRCSGTDNCPPGENCEQRFTHHRGDGVGYKAQMTYCDFTVRGTCGCGPGEVTASAKGHKRPSGAQAG
jgi:hypothetical protein